MEAFLKTFVKGVFDFEHNEVFETKAISKGKVFPI